MLVGVSSASLFMRKDNAESLPCLNALGVKNAEVFLSSFSEYGREYGEFLSSKKGELSVWSVHALNTQFEPQLFSKHQGVKRDAYAVLKNVMEAAQALGAKRYTFHGLTRAKRASRSGEKDDFAVYSACFEELCGYCKDYGADVCLENVEWSTYNRPGVFKKIAENVKGLYGVLDIKQARLSEYPYEVYLSEMGERISHVHLSDIDKAGKMCLPGKGVFDFATLIKRLKDVGFDGALLIEVYQNDYGEEAELKASCEFLEELVDKYGD